MFSRKAGFTLIELMVVVAIIGILMAAGIITFSSAQRNARDAKRRADVDAIAKAFEQYYVSTSRYSNIDILYATSQAGTWTDVNIQAVTGVMFPSGSMPVDPTNTGVYLYMLGAVSNYVPAANPTPRFCVSARLEGGRGNCTGVINTGWANPLQFTCAFVTEGTGTHYCQQSRQ